MSRQPDAPGTFRVRPKGNRYQLSGVKADGTRFKQDVNTAKEGYELGPIIFGGSAPKPTVILPPPPSGDLDDWGLPKGYALPKVSAETIASVTPPSPGVPAADIPGPTIPLATPDTAKEDAEKKVKKAKQAKSICELLGVGWAAGDVYLARKILEPRCETVPKPNVKQVNDLADAAKEAFSDLFGDREVGPWTLLILLSLGIPVAMWVQSTPKKKLEAPPQPNLQSVP